MKEKLNDKQKEVIVIIAAVGLGFILGASFQNGVHLKALKNTVTLTKAVKPMFPDTMPIEEIKKVLSATPGAIFMDALVVAVDGRQSIIVRI